MSKQIRIGGPVFAPVDTPEQFVRHLQEQGFAATYHPRFADPALLSEAVAALAEADIVIAETGAFGINVLDPNAAQRERNIAEICRCLESAERIGSLCCVAHGGWAGLETESRYSGNRLPRLRALDRTTAGQCVLC